MRVGVDVRELERNVHTGIGRFVEALIREGPALRDDWRFVLYGNGKTRALEPPPGSEATTLASPATLWTDQIALPRRLRRDGVDVFFSPYYKAPVASPCPTVVTIHDLIPVRVRPGAIRTRLFRRWAALLAARAAAVLTDSEWSRRELVELLGVAPRRIEVVPLAVERRFSPERRREDGEPARSWGVAGPYVLAVTNFLPHKNDEILLRAFAALADRHPTLSLVLAGRRAGDAAGLERRARELGVAERVVLPGPVPDADLPALYAGARAFALPSLYEGFGLPVLEAMASGVPVACARSSALPEVAGEAALLVDPRDAAGWAAALDRLLVDETLRGRLVEAGLARAARFDWRATVERILGILERVCAS